MDYAVTASLASSIMSLNLVRLVRDAMRTADLSQLARNCSCDVNEKAAGRPAVIYDPPIHVQPPPIVEPRKVIHPSPRVELAAQRAYAASADQSVCSSSSSAGAEAPRRHEPVFQPPWKILPWQNPPAPPIVVKVVARKSDIVVKGTLLDCFL